MNSEQRDRCATFFEHNVIARIDCRDGAVCGVPALILLKIIRDCSPASDVIPIKTGLHHKDAIGLFHDRIIK
jgi:hypothetical protein